MIYFPVAKINLGLRVVSRRRDGYHDIETVFYPVGLTDVLEIVPNQEKTPVLNLSGLPFEGDPGDNLCIKAWKLLAADFGLPGVTIALHKLIPAGAGLGGGSSDATATLVLLNTMFDLRLQTGRLAQYALELGSDCPFFLSPGPMLATGRGENLQPVQLNLKDYSLVLLVPPVHVSTKEAYAGVRPRKPGSSLEDIIRLSPEEWRNQLVNNFEEHIFLKYPRIGAIKKQLYDAGAVYASMSGSGSSVYGLFSKPPSRIEGMEDCLVFHPSL